MGCGSSKSSSYNSNNIQIDNIRVVHHDGLIDDYDAPIQVNQVIKDTENDLLFTRSQLLSTTTAMALKSDYELQLGNIYFLIPISIFSSEASVMDMCNMVNRLTHIAKTTTRFKGSSNEAVGLPRTEYVGLEPEESDNGDLERHVWKPVLDTIREKSLNGRSESDLQCNF